MANKYRNIQAEEGAVAEQKNTTATKKKKAGKKGVLARGLSSVFSGTFLSSDKTLKNLPFILFLAVLAVLYIANGYYADDKVREAYRLSNELKELRSEYISTKSDLMFASKQSELARAAAALELREPVVPPTKILVDSTMLFGKLGEK